MNIIKQFRNGPSVNSQLTHSPLEMLQIIVSFLSAAHLKKVSGTAEGAQ